MPKPLLSTLARQIHLNIRRELHADVAAAGFADLSPIHLYVFQLPGPDGLRPTDLAQQINMTKQATNHLLGELESRGYVTREASPDDGRSKTIRLTKKGLEVMRLMYQNSRRLEREWARSIGKEHVERLRASLIELTAAWSDHRTLGSGSDGEPR